MAATGGVRPGAGRPAGSKNFAYIEAHQLLAEKAVLFGISEDTTKLTAVDVMQIAMYLAVDKGDWRTAVQCAERVAPYIHPKLSAVVVEANVRRSVDQLTDEELVAFIGAAEGQG